MSYGRFAGFLAATVLSLACATNAQAEISISVTIAPPELPVYEQPPVPGPGFLWAPGYWAYQDHDYYWVPPPGSSRRKPASSGLPGTGRHPGTASHGTTATGRRKWASTAASSTGSVTGASATKAADGSAASFSTIAPSTTCPIRASQMSTTRRSSITSPSTTSVTTAARAAPTRA